MRAKILTLALMAAATGCSQTNLLNREPSSDDELREKEVGFGSNYKPEDEAETPQYFEVTIFPDNHYEVEVGEYRSGGEFSLEESRTLGTHAGELTSSFATQLRRELAQLQPPTGSGIYATLPHCPQMSHPDIEYYVAFGSGDRVDMTVVEKGCATSKAAEARRILNKVATQFRTINGAFPATTAR